MTIEQFNRLLNIAERRKYSVLSRMLQHGRRVEHATQFRLCPTPRIEGQLLNSGETDVLCAGGVDGHDKLSPSGNGVTVEDVSRGLWLSRTSGNGWLSGAAPDRRLQSGADDHTTFLPTLCAGPATTQ